MLMFCPGELCELHHGLTVGNKKCTRLYSEEELPAEFKLYLPVQQKGGHQVSRWSTALLYEIASQGRGEGGAQGGVAPPTMQ